MGYLKYAIAALAFTLFAAPSVAEAQNFRTLGTRRGVVGGAILGAIIGDNNNEAFAGAVVGGLVGGTIGNFSGRNLDRQFGGGQPVYNYNGYRGGPYYNHSPAQYQQQYYRPSHNTYYGHGGGYGHGYHQPVYRGYGY